MVLLALLVTFPGPGWATALTAQEDDPNPHSDAWLVSEVQSVRPGESFTVAIRFELDPGWHNYWRNAGDSGLPTTIDWDLPSGWEAGPIQWPYPHRIVAPPLVDYGYSDEVALLVDLTPPADLSPGSSVRLGATVNWLICREICLPAQGEVEITLPVRATSPEPDPRWSELFRDTRAHLPREVAGWTVEAELEGEGYRLTVRKDEQALSLPDSVYFFPAQKSVLAHAAPQEATYEGDVLRLSLSPSPYAQNPVPVLRGVLLAEDGSGWDPEDRTPALAVEAPVQGVEAPGPTEEGTGGQVGKGAGPSGTEEGASAPPEGLAGGAGQDADTATLALALVFAFLGGMLLNLMPCVFPVLSIKILGVAGQGGADRAAMRRDGLFFALGVILSFLALAGVLVALRAGGEQLGWGFQLQSPLFVAFMAALFFAIGLNLMGVFEVGASLTRVGNRAGLSGGPGESMASGVLATVIATPCTAPFMGAALGFALTRSLAETLLIFGILGVGMALPYVVLSSAPGLHERLPRPGPWMETLRNVLAFPMFATVIWLIWVFGQQTGITGTAYLLSGLLFLSVASWLRGRWPRTDLRSGRVAGILALLVLVVAVGMGIRGSAMEGALSQAVEGWRPFSPEEISETLEANQPVFVDFTAAWCLTCQVNERLVLSTEDVQAAFEARDVALFKADWTRQDPEITAALEELGRSGVPVYALYRGGPGSSEDPHLLPAVLTKEIVLRALDEVLSSGAGAPVSSSPDL